jgi:hypothetical protein
MSTNENTPSPFIFGERCPGQKIFACVKNEKRLSKKPKNHTPINILQISSTI